jgi:hypothetical protein
MTRVRIAVLCVAVVLLAVDRASAQDLEPPPPMAPAPAYPPPAASPPSDEGQDSGLGLEWVYLNADAGFGYTNMSSLSETTLAIQKTSSAGGAFGVGAGVRLLFFTVGARARDLQLSAFNLWELDGEAAFHIRIWRIDPYFGVRGGYAFVGKLDSGSVGVAAGGSSSDVSVHGVNIGPMFGIDVYASKLISVGIDANMEFLFLKRPPAPLPAGVTTADIAMLPPQQQQLYQLSGSSVGLGVVGTAHLGVHF